MSKEKAKASAYVNIRNKKASFEYNLLDKYLAGVVLLGSEIKSIREGKASIQQAYCGFTNSELFIRQMNISMYKQASYNNHEPLRERKLLLKRKELKKVKKKIDEKGLTIIPLRLFINKRGLVKIEIAVVSGKKLYDKRQSIKAKDDKRDKDKLNL